MSRVGENFDEALLPAEYVPTLSEDLDLIGKIAITVIRDVATENHLAAFLKGRIDYGDTVEQAVVKLLESTEYDRDGENALAPDDAEKLAVRYFKNWSRKKFKTTIWTTEMKKYLTGEISAEELAGKLVSALGSSDTQELYEGIKALLAWGSSVGSLGDDDAVITYLGDVAGDGEKYDYNGILKKIKNAVKGMKFVNTDFNKAGLKRGTRIEDIIIVMPYTLATDTDVDSLSGFFNLDKAEIRNRIIEVDTTDNKVYILDRNAVLIYTRLYQMLTQLNADGAFYNYYLHVDRMFAISPLFDSCFFTYSLGTAQNNA